MVPKTAVPHMNVKATGHHVPKHRNTPQITTKTTNVSLVMHAPLLQKATTCMEYKILQNTYTKGVVWGYTQRYLKVTDNSESKGKLIQQTLHGLTSILKASMLDKGIHFPIFVTTESRNKENYLNTSCSFTKNNFYVHQEQ